MLFMLDFIFMHYSSNTAVVHLWQYYIAAVAP